MNRRYRIRRVVGVLLLVAAAAVFVINNPSAYSPQTLPPPTSQPPVDSRDTQTAVVPSRAIDALAQLEVKGRAAKTGYERTQFGDGWTRQGNCDTRNIILARDMTDVQTNEQCKVTRGTLQDPYTNTIVRFERGPDSSDKVQIDHVVALSDAWQKGAQQLDLATRIQFANDPLELLAVDGAANQQKSDGDAATWLPSNKQFRCQYIARQIAIKLKYKLWVVEPEHDAMVRVLTTCPDQLLPK